MKVLKHGENQNCVGVKINKNEFFCGRLREKRRGKNADEKTKFVINLSLGCD